MLDCSKQGIIQERRTQIEVLSSYKDSNFWLNSPKKIEKGEIQEQNGEEDISYSAYRSKKGIPLYY